MNRMLKGWKQTGRTAQFRAHIVNYADDFVIACRGDAAAALEWTGGAVGRMGLTLNEKKTSIRDARKGRFEFLGYSFGPHFSRKTGRDYIGVSPSLESESRIKQYVSELLDRRNVKPWFTMNAVGKPDAGNRHVRFDERGWETGRRFSRQYPRLSSTILRRVPSL